MMQAAAGSAQRVAAVPVPDAAAALLARVAAELTVAAGDPWRVTEACALLIAECGTDAAAENAAYDALGPLLAASPNRRGAAALFECLQARALSAGAPPQLYQALLHVRERDLRLRAVTALALAVEQRMVPPPALLERLAAALSDCTTVPPGLQAILHAVAGSDGVPQLLAPGQPPWLRWLAALLLDSGGQPPTPEHAALALGGQPATRLARYLAFTRATYRDLLWLTDPGSGAIPLVAALDDAERLLGQERLARALAELGWTSVAMGLEVVPLTRVRVGTGFPLLVTPIEAALLAECGGVERLGDAMLVIAHGRVEQASATPAAEAQAERIRRFREYNVVHADLLNDILEVAPLTVARARSMLERVRRLATDFAWLFGQHDDEAVRVEHEAQRLCTRAAALLPDGDAAVLGGEAMRLLQAFEDPATIDRVTTIHGLKRYLHQRGLRNAFRLFASGSATNRTVDLLLDADGTSSVTRRIRYIEFEPAHAGTLPPIVRLLVESYARWIAHGTTRLPDARLLIYAHEVQLYLSFRAHPAFIRMDLSPPRRGGMIDLEYFAVSQNELAQHPARDLGAMQEFLRRIGYHVTLEGLRIHARYDKERAFDRADILDKAAALLRLAPLLMDLDWTIGSLEYPPDSRLLVQAAWGALFERHGVLPLDALLTADRCRVLLRRHGAHDDGWDGRGVYPDAFGPDPDPAWWAALGAVLERRGLAGIARLNDAVAPAVGQLELERRLLLPLRAALAAGAVTAAGGALRCADPDRYRSEHEAVRLAALLHEGGAALEDAARLGAVVHHAFALFRFRTTGTVQGCRVERADLALSAGPTALFALRDGHGTIQLACAVAGNRPARVRDTTTGPWRWHGDVRAADLFDQLLRDNYMAPAQLLGPLHAASAGGMRERFALAALRPPRAVLPQDRVVDAEPAAPGRAAGVVRFGGQPQQLHGAILAAPVVRAEDGPLLKAANAIVTTGGGILSHAALIALELRKPSLLLRGRWHTDGGGTTTLRLTRTEFLERRVRVGPYDVVCRDVAREHEEELCDGDLAVVDADEGTFRLLGRDHAALTLHHGLADLEHVVRQLADTSDDARVLELRGRMLRTMHSLRRQVARLAHPGLAHYVARQLLATPPEPAAPAAGPQRRELLRLLLANPIVGAAAADAATAAVTEMGGRFRELADTASSTIPHLARPLEIIFLHHAVARLAAALRGLRAIHGDGAPVDEPATVAAAVDALAAARLRELRAHIATGIETCADEGAGAAVALHLAAQLRVIDAVLDGAPCGSAHTAAGATSLRVWPAQAHLTGTESLRRRNVVSAIEGGFELAAIAGNKAAGLGELVRILGSDAVPPWFAVTDHAFRTVLTVPLPALPGDADQDVARPARHTLGTAIEAVLARPGLEARDRAAAIAALWRDVTLPPALVAEIREAYARLGDERDGHAPDVPGTDAGSRNIVAIPVAVRSSSLEEDRTDAAWAGQFCTFLNVAGPDAVLQHVKLAWAGLWSERVLLHRGASAAAPGGGVIVQRMVAARVAGVLHTVGAATAELRTMVANVGIGLGEGVVSGEVGVDEVRITKGADIDSPVIDVQYAIGDKREQVVPDSARGGTTRTESSYHQRFRAALEYAEVLELARAGAMLEAALGQPLDIEFAFEDDRLRVLQVRPIPVFHHAFTETLRRFPIQASQ
jgi:hypothetical protein